MLTIMLVMLTCIAAMSVYGYRLRTLLPVDATAATQPQPPIERHTLAPQPPPARRTKATPASGRIADLGLHPWFVNRVYGRRVVASLLDTPIGDDDALLPALDRLDTRMQAGNRERGRFPFPMTTSRPTLTLLTPDLVSHIRTDVYRVLNEPGTTQTTRQGTLSVTSSTPPGRGKGGCLSYRIAFAKGWFGDSVRATACYRPDRAEWSIKANPSKETLP